MNNSSNFSGISTSEGNSKDKDFWLAVWIVIDMCFVIGVVANILILVVVKRTPSMHSAINVLLCSLAISDLVLLLWPCVGMEVFFYFSKVVKYTGNFGCKFASSIPTIVFVYSFLTVSLIAGERYRALVNAMDSSTRRLTLKNVKYALLVVMIIAMISAVPAAVLLEFDKEDRDSCRLRGSGDIMKALISTYYILFIFVPMIITCYCYFRIVSGVCISKTILKATSASREEVQMRRKLVQTSVLAATAFVLCYAPVGIISILFYLEDVTANVFGMRAIIALYVPMCVKAIINPFLYAFHSTNYRTAVKSMCRCTLTQKRRQALQEVKMNQTICT